jgi:hypothetical protein
MDDDDRCPRCGISPDPLDAIELASEDVQIGAVLEARGECRDWIFLSDVELMVYGRILDPAEATDPDLEGIFGALDEVDARARSIDVQRERLRDLLRMLGWEHVPLRSLVDDEGRPRELWSRTMGLQEIEKQLDKYHTRDHAIVGVLGEYLGMERVHRRRPRHDTDHTRAQREAVVALLKETKRPMWAGEIARTLGFHAPVINYLMAMLRGEERVVVFTHRGHRLDATYVHPDYAAKFRHMPVKEMLEVDDEQEIDIYEEVSRILAGSTAVREHRLDAAFPNVQTTILRRVLDQMGWRPRSIQKQTWWVGPEHPQHTSRNHATRSLDAEIEARKSVYREEPPEAVEEEPAPLDENEVRVLSVLQDGGLAGAREIAKGAKLSTRRTAKILRELVQAGKVKSFPMGASEGFVAL